MSDFLLLESGSYLLLETGSHLQLDIPYANIPPPMSVTNQRMIPIWKKKRHMIKHRKFATFPVFETWFKILPFIIPAFPPMIPDPNKQYIPIRNRLKALKLRRHLIKTFRITIITALYYDIFGSTIGDTSKQKMIIQFIKRKVLVRRKLNLKFGTPKYQAWQATNPGLSSSVYAAPTQPYLLKQFIPKWIRKKIMARRMTLFKRAPQFQAWFMVFLELRVSEIQPYLLKQFIPLWKKRARILKHRKMSSFPVFQSWYGILPALSAKIYAAAIQPDRFKQLLPKIKSKISLRRRFIFKYGIPKYQAWRDTNPALSPSVWAAAVQPYLLKQFIPIIKRKLSIRRRFNAKYGIPKFVAWFKVLPAFIPSAAVIQPYRYLNLFTKWKHRLAERKKRLIATRAAENYRMTLFTANIHQVLETVTLTVINTLQKILKVTK